MLLLNYCNKKNKSMKDIEYRRNINIDIDIYMEYNFYVFKISEIFNLALVMLTR